MRKTLDFTRKTFDFTRKTFDFTRKTMIYDTNGLPYTIDIYNTVVGNVQCAMQIYTCKSWEQFPKVTFLYGNIIFNHPCTE